MEKKFDAITLIKALIESGLLQEECVDVEIAKCKELLNTDINRIKKLFVHQGDLKDLSGKKDLHLDEILKGLYLVYGKLDVAEKVFKKHILKKDRQSVMHLMPLSTEGRVRDTLLYLGVLKKFLDECTQNGIFIEDNDTIDKITKQCMQDYEGYKSKAVNSSTIGKKQRELEDLTPEKLVNDVKEILNGIFISLGKDINSIIDSINDMLHSRQDDDKTLQPLNGLNITNVTLLPDIGALYESKELKSDKAHPCEKVEGVALAQNSGSALTP